MQPLLEEEKASALEALDNVGGLTASLLNELGPDAIALVRAMWHRGGLDYLPFDIQPGPARLMSTQNADPKAVERVSWLLQAVKLQSDLRDAGLHSHESTRLSTFSVWSNEDWETYIDSFARMIEREGIAPRNYIRKMILRNGFPWVLTPGLIPQTGVVNQSALHFPLLRILHLREILDAPELSWAGVHPERFMVPGVLLHILEVEPVLYFPELRIGNKSGRRWRARWAESMGETISTLFMEAALDIDLTLLERIPETSSEMTADFKTATKQGELIVYEAKGSTNWETHLKQRRKALKQIGKSRSQAGRSRGGFGSNGRAFACSFYGGLQGEPQSTLFHVQDPPFGFDYLFRKGWEQQARRRHYAAVLQFADQFELAEQLLKPEVDTDLFFTLIHRRERQKFRLRLGGEGQEDSLYVGSYDDIEFIARRIGLQNPGAFQGWKLFRGIEERKLFDLARGRLQSADRPNDEEERLPYIPSTGVIPGENRGHGRGVYSLLPNGSFLAIEIGQELGSIHE